MSWLDNGSQSFSGLTSSRVHVIENNELHIHVTLLIGLTMSLPRCLRCMLLSILFLPPSLNLHFLSAHRLIYPFLHNYFFYSDLISHLFCHARGLQLKNDSLAIAFPICFSTHGYHISEDLHLR